MHLFYIDDSHDLHFFTFAAIGIPAECWQKVFNAVRDYRITLRKEHGIYLWKELHAWKFTSGRGRPSSKFLSKNDCIDIYLNSLAFLASQARSGVILFGATSSKEEWAFERLLNRINRTMKTMGSHAALHCDEGNEAGFTAISRRLAVFNYIPSKYGQWQDTGEQAKNIPTDRILEDPVFKPSHRSYLIQLADFCAYALFQKERPNKIASRAPLEHAYELLQPICFKPANSKDPFGIVRDNK